MTNQIPVRFTLGDGRISRFHIYNEILPKGKTAVNITYILV